MESFLLSVLKYLFAGGAFTAIVAFFGRSYFEKWFQGRFDAQLERIKYKINTHFDRAVRLHEMEFDVLPELWGKLLEAFYPTRMVVAIPSYPEPLDRMSTPELEHVLTKSALFEFEKDQVRAAPNKQQLFATLHAAHEIRQIRQSYGEYQEYFMKKVIFLPPSIEAKFREVGPIIAAAIDEHANSIAASDPNAFGEPRVMPREQRDELEKRGVPLMENLRSIVQLTLQDSRIFPA